MTSVAKETALFDGRTIYEDEDEGADSTCTSQTREGNSHGSNSFDGNAMVAVENRQVLFSKLGMLVVLLLSALGVGYATWHYTSMSEEDEFKKSFEGFANEIIKVSQINANSKFEALKSLALSVTSYALDDDGGSNWPFVTVMPSFYFEGQHTLEQLDALWIAQFPFIYPETRDEWELYTQENREWRNESWAQLASVYPDPAVPPIPSDCIFRINFTDGSSECDGDDFPDLPFFAPTYGISAPFTNGISLDYTNYNIFSDPKAIDITKEMMRTGAGVVSEAAITSLYGDEWEGDFLPDCYLAMPVYDSHEPNAEIVSMLISSFPWTFFNDILSDSKADGIVLSLANPCGSSFTFEINGPNVTFTGEGDLHDPEYDYMAIAAKADDIRTPEACRYIMTLYPSVVFEDQYRTNEPIHFTVAAVLIFVVTTLLFVLYDAIVQKRQNIVMTSANRTGALVNSMYPKAVRDRILMEETMEEKGQNESSMFGLNKKDENSPIAFFSKPIADYYPEGTIMVADLVGFSAWSSEREPAQVFTLLESLYNGFDKIGQRRKIFKVETHGDCYVASAGVPDPMKNHAVIMCRYANECRSEMLRIVSKLEVFLGPDTGDLRMKIGIDSGPITGGVLRGAKSRFQLFGSTLDNAHTLQDTGMAGRIHVSPLTADLLKQAGKSKWLNPSDKTVPMKGHSDCKTYWLKLAQQTPGANVTEDDSSGNHSVVSTFDDLELEAIQRSSDDDKKKRLVDWNADNFTRLLKRVVAMREQSAVVQETHITPSDNPLNELKETITLGSDTKDFKCDPSAVELPPVVISQLRDYISAVADGYHDNPFHSFEHACHVTQAISKLLSRIVSSEAIDTSTMTYKKKAAASDLHDNTFGLTSDPIIEFACALSALIHDMDHPGVPNATLVKEKKDIAAQYNNLSVAEQNSVDLGWSLLMEDRFTALRNCIYTNQTELERFRQLVVNSVLATDIVDKELSALRKGRWNKAFSTDWDGDEEESEKDIVDRKATIVIEHLIQAADVSHMMQHWNTYRKWNEMFFRECYKGYLTGRSDTDPSLGWYEGEKGFYDFYVIPLARKLATCGVFGVSSDEFLNYALANRKEWETKGEDVVKEYIANYHDQNSKAVFEV